MSTINKKTLVDYLSEPEQELLKAIQERADKNLTKIPALYRDNKVTQLEIQVKKQIEDDKTVLQHLQHVAAVRKAKIEQLSRKINDEQYEEIQRKFGKQETS